MAKNDERFHRGKWRDALRRKKGKGWFVGEFMKQKPRRTDLFELKYWENTVEDFTPHVMKTSCTIECTLILAGRVKGEIAGQPVDLSAGEYVVIAPGTPNAIPQKVIENAKGMTVKAPSIRVAKHIMGAGRRTHG
jgi:uncharacterized cupin superfamily protein